MLCANAAVVIIAQIYWIYDRHIGLEHWIGIVIVEIAHIKLFSKKKKLQRCCWQLLSHCISNREPLNQNHPDWCTLCLGGLSCAFWHQFTSNVTASQGKIVKASSRGEKIRKNSEIVCTLQSRRSFGLSEITNEKNLQRSWRAIFSKHYLQLNYYTSQIARQWVSTLKICKKKLKSLKQLERTPALSCAKHAVF